MTYQFKPGTYFVGDLGFVLPPNALRVLFTEIMNNNGVREGYRNLSSTDGGKWQTPDENLYWITPTPYKAGTLFDQTGKAYGFDWCLFGCMRFNMISTESSYEDNKVIFNEPFTCSSTPEIIMIGHLQFTLNPPSP
jgi:hypothetical protein